MKSFAALCLTFFFSSLLCSGLFSQEDSLVYYFNRSSPSDIEKGELILNTYSEKDSVKFAWIASKLTRKESKVNFFHAVGSQFYDVDNYEVAKIYFAKALHFARLTLNKKMIADELEELGDMYRLQDQNTVALNLLFQAMYLYKELGDIENVSHTLAVIGDVNRCLEQYNDALRYLNEALEVSTRNNYISDQTFAYSSLGGTYQSLKQYDKANESYKKGLAIASAGKDTMRIIDYIYSIGDLRVDENKVGEALPYFSEGIRLAKITGDKYNMAFCYIGQGRAYLKRKDYNKAIESGLVGYDFGEKLKASGFNTEAAEVLYEGYYGKGDFKNAYKYLKEVKDNSDSTLSSSKIKQQAQMEMNFQNAYEEKQDSLVRAGEQKQKDLVYESELQRQKTLAVAGVAGLLIAVIVTALVYKSYKKEKRSSEIINKQKAIVDAKNKEVLDSINYAKKIQEAIIPTRAELRNVFPQSFVMLLPKDIVSGDFYWLTRSGQQVFFAVADCTGHGVPGGFMSMLGTALLNEIITEKHIHEPCDILDMLKLKIILALRQSDNTNENKDGMDIAVFRLDLNLLELTFAGANNSMYLLRGKSLTEFKGNKFPIGFAGTNNIMQFSQQKMQLKKDDLLYMFTDGYPDQFGGPQGKKLKYKPLEEMLIANAEKPMDEQRKILIDAHEKWKGELEQVDDICIAGIRI
ncbi:MAG: tetratricopeptide repeat protein [Bacteroidota bacterium]|nr:tetratricopeptide repeat protein [Bacteroidota bacterium]